MRPSRETRLLILTITVSAVVLLLLARLRFPEPPAAVQTTEQPLERLAVQASFEELAIQVARVESAIAGNLLVLRTQPADVAAPRRLGDVLRGDERSVAAVRHIPALRIGATTAIAAIPAESRITGIVGAAAAAGTAGIEARDPIRSLARLRVPEAEPRPMAQLSLGTLPTPTYVVAVEGTHAGVTLRPVFLGRSDRFASPRWSRPLLPLGGAFVSAGALVFTLSGEFLGCAVIEDGVPAIAGALDLLESAERMERTPPPVDPGIAVQPMTPALALATGAMSGVVIAEVSNEGVAAGRLQPGDVVTNMDEHVVEGPERFLVELGVRLAAGPVRLTGMRTAKPFETVLAVAGESPANPRNELSLEAMPRTGTRILDVPDGSVFARAGLEAGDVIVGAGVTEAPPPDTLRRLINAIPRGSSLLLTVRRGGRQHIAALRNEESGPAAGQ